MPPVLEIRDISIRFGGLQANEDISIDVGEWEIVGLIGPNGAGKTTFYNCITGIYKPDRGTVVYRGKDITKVPTFKRVSMGMARTWQNLGVVRSLTVLENVMTAQHHQVKYGSLSGMLGFPRTFVEEKQVRRNAEEILDFLGLLDVRNEITGGLSYGVQKLADLAMALATEPDVLLLDEPSSGMAPEEAHQLGETLRYLRDSLNLTIMMIEHHVPLVVGLCDYVYVLNFGRLLTHGDPHTVRNHPDVITAYLGEDADAAAS
jgi:branched-chain amino acid transport system ATP-binding protein